jgi:hypothetical protein
MKTVNFCLNLHKTLQILHKILPLHTLFDDSTKNKLSSPEPFPIFSICLFIQPKVELVDNDFKSTSTIFVINFFPLPRIPSNNLARFNFNVKPKNPQNKNLFWVAKLKLRRVFQLERLIFNVK